MMNFLFRCSICIVKAGTNYDQWSIPEQTKSSWLNNNIIIIVAGAFSFAAIINNTSNHFFCFCSLLSVQTVGATDPFSVGRPVNK